MDRLRSMSRGCLQSRLEYGDDGGAGAVRETRSLVQARLGMQMLLPAAPRRNKTGPTAPQPASLEPQEQFARGSGLQPSS
jgi:hypothetical protein